ncbi:MAG: phosphoribosylformylglycinamidine synthase subunit PurS [Bacteroidota bacterium]|nr:phosphoribosylformylglycinamidine synthase subunit PurS [Bacteroidota bacterium]MDP4226685.1 phosphoribosylformylglycinamidine synthase subunit PurS [Bacteroidota bacterium]MDP4272964.1 phosphoribosylformylglycinamidine synthase subunit PurS [Bacteroidota bacterium]
MNFIAEISIMPLKSLPDPQGMLISSELQKLGFSDIRNIRIGKHITLEITANSKEAAMERVKDSCNLLLHNPVTEGYEYTIKEV